MHLSTNVRRGLSYGVLILGAAVSAALVAAFPEFYHHGDIEAMTVWAQQWNKGWIEVYNTCPGCNYPILGIFGTAGALKLLAKLGVADLVLGYRFFLAAVDAANVILVFLLFRALRIKNAALWAGIIGLLPSSWAGGAVWGQIDGIGQCMLLLVLLWIVGCNLSGKVPFPLYLAGSSLGLAMLLLTKQLNLFSVLSLEFLLIVTICKGRKLPAAAGYLLLQAGLLCVFLFGWDLPLNVEGGLVSHQQIVWGSRSSVGDVLSMNGVNLWTLLDRNMQSSSAIPLFPDLPIAVLRALTPFNVGVVLFMATASSLAVAVGWRIGKRHPLGSSWLGRESLLTLVGFLALINLAFNVALTGTHERYLYSFYPLVLLAFLGLREFNRRFSLPLVVLLVVGANVYGVFVLGILTGDFAFSYGAHHVEAVFHGGLLFLVLVVFFRYLLEKQRPPADLPGGR